MSQSILTKESQNNEIRLYFEAIFRMTQGNENFPVNLDEVWQLVYAEKGKAVRALKKDFIENEDFVTVAQNGKGGQFGSVDYMLSISCLEYFIARKVRPVFEVYRKVFHKTTEQKLLTPAEAFLQQAQLMVDVERRQRETEVKILHIESKLNGILEIQANTEAELKAIPVSTETLPEMELRDKIRFLVNRYCQALGVLQQGVWDNIYQTLYYTYHVPIKSYSKINKKESWLDVADRKGHVDKIYIIVSNMLKNKGLSTI